MEFAAARARKQRDLVRDADALANAQGPEAAVRAEILVRRLDDIVVRAMLFENDNPTGASCQVLTALTEALQGRKGRCGVDARCSVLRGLIRLGSACEDTWEAANASPRSLVPQRAFDYLPRAMECMAACEDLWTALSFQLESFASQGKSARAHQIIELAPSQGALEVLTRLATWSVMSSAKSLLAARGAAMTSLCSKVLCSPFVANIESDAALELAFRGVELGILLCIEGGLTALLRSEIETSIAAALCRAPRGGAMARTIIEAIQMKSRDLRPLLRSHPWIAVALLEQVAVVPTNVLACLPVSILAPCVAQGWIYVAKSKNDLAEMNGLLTRFSTDPMQDIDAKLEWLSLLQAPAARMRPTGAARSASGGVPSVGQFSPRRPKCRGRAIVETKAAGVVLGVQVSNNHSAWIRPLIDVLQIWAHEDSAKDPSAQTRRLVAQTLLSSSCKESDADCVANEPEQQENVIA